MLFLHATSYADATSQHLRLKVSADSVLVQPFPHQPSLWLREVEVSARAGCKFVPYVLRLGDVITSGSGPRVVIGIRYLKVADRCVCVVFVLAYCS